MHLYKSKVLNLRIRMPIVNYNHPRNFITKIISYKNIYSCPNSMTVLNDFYPIIFDMIIKKTVGTFNLCNKGVISHNQILELYKSIINPNHSWNNCSIIELNSSLKSKRSNNQLSISKLESLGYNIPHINDSIHKTLISFNSN